MLSVFGERSDDHCQELSGGLPLRQVDGQGAARVQVGAAHGAQVALSEMGGGSSLGLGDVGMGHTSNLCLPNISYSL